MLISLVILPGRGQEDVTVRDGSTVADLIESRGLTGYQVMVDGATVASNALRSVVFRPGGVREVVAVRDVKGA